MTMKWRNARTKNLCGMLAALGMALVGPGFAVQGFAAESRYTDLDTNACEKLSEEEGMGVSLKCEGLDGLPVYFKEGDLRMSLFFGAVPQSYIDEGFETFGAFNSVGTKIEWRSDGNDRPRAAILRWFLDNIDPDTGAVDPKRRGQVLVISRVAATAEEKGCMVGFVDALANADANALARNVADTVAPDFQCGSDTPVYHGERGDKAGEPSRHLPE